VVLEPPYFTLWNGDRHIRAKRKYLPHFIHSGCIEDDIIFFQAGTHTDTMSMKYADFARLVKPTVADFKRHARAVGQA